MYVCMVEDRLGSGFGIQRYVFSNNFSLYSIRVYAHVVLNVLFCDNLGSSYILGFKVLFHVNGYSNPFQCSMKTIQGCWHSTMLLVAVLFSYSHRLET